MGLDMEFLDIPPRMSAQGVVRLPGSKSISNRCLLLAALAHGQTQIRDLLSSDDVHHMLNALSQLGVTWTREPGTDHYQVQGIGGVFPVKTGDFFLGNAGTAMRSLTAALALSGGNYRVHGVARMHERPIADLVDALRQIGADIHYEGESGFPPLRFLPGQIQAGRTAKVRGDVSSQFLTALLMALPLTGEQTTIEVVGELISKPYIEITLALMARFGVKVKQDGESRFIVPGGAQYVSPGVLHVEGDASSASYFLAAGALGQGPVRVEGVGRDSIQGDVMFAKALEKMGARITFGDNWIEAAAPKEGQLKAFDEDFNAIPDAAMTLAVAALFADGPCTLRNIGSWRVKETDRIAAMATELRKLGAQVKEGADWLCVEPLKTLKPATIHTYEDHRIAMCFSLATLAGVPLRIMDPKCVNKTFPTYFDVFDKIAKSAPIIVIDGPSASGKGAVASRVAEQLGFHYLDSGALYRLVAYSALQKKIDFLDEAKLAECAQTLPVRFEDGHIFFESTDVTETIRSEACSEGASKVAALATVREALVLRQRQFYRMPGLVAEGRDMAELIFPQAPLKIFLTADPKIRAERRHKQLIEKGITVNIESLAKDLEARDLRDSKRAVAPLRCHADAFTLDTSNLTLNAAVERVVGMYHEKKVD